MRFHQRRNLIIGRNHTGKSSLIRALFETLGAMPQGELEEWDDNTVSLLEFNVDGAHFFAVRERSNRALFNGNGMLIGASGSNSIWAKLFAEVTGFNLVCSDKKSQVVQADPSCFFLPFYVNQDGSWQSEWNTFSGMKRFTSPWSAILEYFSGICPPEYYARKAERDLEASNVAEVRRESDVLDRARARFGKSVSLSGPKLESKNFEDEIHRLTAEVSELNRKQEQLRSTSVREQELLRGLLMQTQLANEALRTHEKDAHYLRHEPSEPLICPTCKAEHTKPFLDLIEFAESARLVRDMVVRLNEDISVVRSRNVQTRAALSGLNANYRRVKSVLDTTRGELKFRDVVQSMGAEDAFKAFEEESASLRKKINEHLEKIEHLDRRLRELRNPSRSKAILSAFRDYYSHARAALKLPAVNTSKLKLTNRPALSGSGGPRSILAYYAAIWRVAHMEGAAFSVPVVIDSPNQQGQDDVNLPAVLQFIAKDLPEGLQLIVGLEKEASYPFDKEFRLVEKYSLLNKGEAEDVEATVLPFLEKMHGALATERDELF